jgi:hypothetical protein
MRRAGAGATPFYWGNGLKPVATRSRLVATGIIAVAGRSEASPVQWPAAQVQRRSSQPTLDPAQVG